MVIMHGQFCCTVEWEMLAVENFDESTNKVASWQKMFWRIDTKKW